jgi:anti-anti-sigma factor
MDVSKVHSIDSSGVGIIAFSFGKLSKHGGRFFLAGATGNVLDILQMTRLDSVIPFSNSVNEACSAIESQA